MLIQIVSFFKQLNEYDRNNKKKTKQNNTKKNYNIDM